MDPSSLSTKPSIFILNGVRYSAFRRATFVINQRMLDHYYEQETSGVIVFVDPTGDNQKGPVKCKYVFDNNDVEKKLIPKTKLDCWDKRQEWSESSDPVEFKLNKYEWNSISRRKYVDQVVEALKSLGGSSNLESIYSYIKANYGFDIAENSAKGGIRRAIYNHSSDADEYVKSYPDIFESVDGKGSGTWAIRAHTLPALSHVNESIQDLITSTEVDDFKEGKKYQISHYKRERNQTLVKKAKMSFKKEHGRLFCESCSFSFEEKYGSLGNDYIEAHHLTPVSELKEGDSTKIKDLIMLCSNCHRMVHRLRPWPKSLYEIKKLLEII